MSTHHYVEDVREQPPGSTRYDAHISRIVRLPNGTYEAVDLLVFTRAPAYELSPALKALVKKIHESPPPVVLEGQESML